MPHDSERHSLHDPLLVASLAAGDLSGTDRDRATTQVRECADCASLHADLIALARATAALPAAVAPRDFRLTPDQAASLRPVGWRRIVAAVGGSRPLMSRQLGIGLATIGLAGLLVSTLPTINLGSAASMPAPEAAQGGAATSQELTGGAPDIVGEHPSAAPMYGDSSTGGAGETTAAAPAMSSQSQNDASGRGSALVPMGTPAASPGRVAYDSNASSKSSDFERALTAQGENPTPTTPTSSSDGGRSAFMIGSLALFVAGVVLLVVRRLVRRPSLG